MILNLYSCGDDPNVVDKTLQAVATNIPIKPTGSVNVLKPTIIINYNAAYLAANYAYLSDFGRYYFIASANVETGKQITLNSSVDVLYTYRADIRASAATVIRSESIGKPTYIPDQRLPIAPSEQVITSALFDKKAFGIASFGYNYVLTVQNGG